MTFKQLQDKVLALMDEEGDTNTILTNTKTFINDALKSRAMERKWPWLLSNEVTLTLEPNEQYALLPSNYYAMHWVKNGNRLLTQLPLTDRFDFSANYDNGDYVIYGDRVHFLNSNIAGPLSMQYYKVPAELVDDTDEPDFPERFQMIVVWDAIIGLKGYHGELENIEYLLERQRRLEQAMYVGSYSADSVGHKPLQVSLAPHLY
jgi:hypothetical protein